MKRLKASHTYFVGIETGNYYHFYKTEFEITTDSMPHKIEGTDKDTLTTNALKIKTHESEVGEHLMSRLQFSSGVLVCVAQGSDETPSKHLGDGYQHV